MDKQHTSVLTDYEKYIFHSFETKCEINKPYVIEKSRTDYKNFMDALQKRMELFEDLEFNLDKTKFRKVRTYEQEVERFKKK
jgi:hypothetical protein